MDANEAAARAWEMRVSLMRVAQSILHHSADAEDAVSTAMLNAYRRADRLTDEGKFSAWQMRILVHCCYDILRKRKHELPQETLDAQEGLQAPLEGTEGSVLEAIRQLPQADQRVLILHYYEGFKAREIAHILSVPTGTVLGRLFRGRNRLKQILDREGVVYHDEQTV